MRLLVLIGLLAGSTTGPGCGDGESVAALQRDPSTLIIARPADAMSLDPGRASDVDSFEVTEQIFEALLRYDPVAQAIEPGLAERWEVSDDGTAWTFFLREGVRFHDGSPLEAAAVVFSLERQRDAEHPYHDIEGETQRFTYWANTYQNIRSVEAVGELAVRIVIDRPFAPFEANMAMFPVAIVSPAAVAATGADFDRNPVGTGPYRFREWSESRIVLERNRDYWGRRRGWSTSCSRRCPTLASVGSRSSRALSTSPISRLWAASSSSSFTPG